MIGTKLLKQLKSSSSPLTVMEFYKLNYLDCQHGAIDIHKPFCANAYQALIRLCLSKHICQSLVKGFININSRKCVHIVRLRRVNNKFIFKQIPLALF